MPSQRLTKTNIDRSRLEQVTAQAQVEGITSATKMLDKMVQFYLDNHRKQKHGKIKTKPTIHTMAPATQRRT